MSYLPYGSIHALRVKGMEENVLSDFGCLFSPSIYFLHDYILHTYVKGCTKSDLKDSFLSLEAINILKFPNINGIL